MPMSRLVTAAAAALLLAGAAAPLPAQDTQEQGNVVVFACVNRKGELLSAEVARTSGFAQLDQAALKIARATKYSPATDGKGKPKRKSCLHFMVKFVIKDGEVVPAG